MDFYAFLSLIFLFNCSFDCFIYILLVLSNFLYRVQETKAKTKLVSVANLIVNMSCVNGHRVNNILWQLFRFLDSFWLFFFYLFWQFFWQLFSFFFKWDPKRKSENDFNIITPKKLQYLLWDNEANYTIQYTLLSKKFYCISNCRINH